jgi:hypothetical protein
MIKEKKPKQAKLYEDEFNPHGVFNSFWRIPRPLMKLDNVSLGAKMLYGVLMVYAGSYGTAYPSRETLQEAMGKPSYKTIYNWQKELVKAGLIRVRQKGRGLPNNYYFLRTPIFGNADQYEYEEGERCIYKGPQVKTPIVLSVPVAKQFFTEDVRSWYERSIGGELIPFPKPCWLYDKVVYKKIKQEWETKLTAYFNAM